VAAHGRCTAGKAPYHRISSWRGAVSGPAPDHSTAPPRCVTVPKTVPYECFRLKPERVKDKGSTPEAIKAKEGYRSLLLWFVEDVLTASTPGTPDPAPLLQFAKLLCPYLPVKGTTGDKVNVKILGPQLSTTLKAMVDQVNGEKWSKD